MSSNLKKLPALDDNMIAKDSFKKLLVPNTVIPINITGWEEADPNYEDAETTLVLSVDAGGVLACGQPFFVAPQAGSLIRLRIHDRCSLRTNTHARLTPRL